MCTHDRCIILDVWLRMMVSISAVKVDVMIMLVAIILLAYQSIVSMTYCEDTYWIALFVRSSTLLFVILNSVRLSMKIGCSLFFTWCIVFRSFLFLNNGICDNYRTYTSSQGLLSVIMVSYHGKKWFHVVTINGKKFDRRGGFISFDRVFSRLVWQKCTFLVVETGE